MSAATMGKRRKRAKSNLLSAKTSLGWIIASYSLLTFCYNSHMLSMLDAENAERPVTTAAKTIPMPRSSASLRSGNATNLQRTSIERADSTSKVSFPYWNLSCPLEMSTFSAARMGNNYTTRAYKALKVARPATTIVSNYWRQRRAAKRATTSAPQPRRILFVGDSLLRQIFISLSCLSPTAIDIADQWLNHRTGRTNHPNTIAIGEHSKFEEARVWLENEDEMIYHFGIGNLISLGKDYRNHDTHSWMEACMRRRPFQATVLQRGRHSEGYVKRETIHLTDQDVVIFNGSVHGDRLLNLYNLRDLLQCMNTTTTGQQRSRPKWPKLLYMATSVEHFPTDNGEFDELLLNATSFDCLQHARKHERLQQEQELLGDTGIPFVGLDVLDLQYKSGDLHVGGRDCLHWIMPGIPDLMAVSLLRKLREYELAH